jgi:hypothetical protein
MKAITESLRHFITDFELERKDNIICFEALIYFSTNTDVILLPTEVQIVTIGTDIIDVVYLLHPDVIRHGIPDMYAPSLEKFGYLKNKALIIKGDVPLHGNYILSIHPGNKECDDATLMEIHAKTYN